MFHVKQSPFRSSDALAQLQRSLPIRDCTHVAGIVRDDSLTVARRLGNAHRSRDDRLKSVVREVRTNLALDLFGELRALVRHRQQHAGDTQAGVKIDTDPFDGVPQLAEALQGVILSLNRDHNLVGGDHDIQRHKAE